MKMNIIFFLFFIGVLISFNSVLASTTLKKTYNFNATYENISMWAWDTGNTGALHPSTTIHPSFFSTEITTDSDLDSSDDTRESDSGSIATGRWYGAFLFKVQVQESLNDITLLNWTWEGQTNYNDNIKLHIWNVSASNYSLITTGGGVANTDYTLSASSNSASSFINSSNYTHLWVYAPDLYGENTLSTDFVKLEVTYTDNAPTFSNNKTNSTSASPKINQDIQINLTINDTYGLSSYKFSWNESGSWVNVSNVSISGTSFNMVINKTVTAQNHPIVGWRVYANDTLNQWNESEIYSFEIINSPPTMTGAELNKTSGVVDTDDLNCTATGASDVDSDTTTYHYEWYNNSDAQGIDNEKLGSGNLTSGQVWYCEAWVTDGYLNSSKYTTTSVKIGSSETAPSIDSTNATTASTGVNSTSTNPTNNNSWINFSVAFTDANTNKWTAYFCNTPAQSDCINNVSSSIYCMSPANLTDKTLSCRYDVYSLTTSSNNYYAFVLDNESLVSTGKTNTFTLNFPPTTPTTTNNTYLNYNWNLINFSSTDSDSDLINYTIYANETITTLNQIYTGNLSYFNWTGLSDGVYYTLAFTTDEHSYSNNINSSIYTFTIDTIKPNLTLTSPTATTYSSKTISITYTANDTNYANCTYNIYQEAYWGTATSETGGNVSCNSSFTVTAWTDYVFNMYVSDLANNVNSTQINFTTSQPSTVVETGGGGGVPREEPKKICNITVTTQESTGFFMFDIIYNNITFNYDENLKRIFITSYEKNLTISPSYKIKDNYGIDIKGYVEAQLVYTQPVELTLLRNYTINETMTTELIISSPNCKDISTLITLNEYDPYAATIWKGSFKETFRFLFRKIVNVFAIFFRI